MLNSSGLTQAINTKRETKATQQRRIEIQGSKALLIYKRDLITNGSEENFMVCL
jgi:hypothetical protein